jgi:hypothetical protein
MSFNSHFSHFLDWILTQSPSIHHGYCSDTVEYVSSKYYRVVLYNKNKYFFFRGLHAEIQDVYLIYIRVLVLPPLIGSTTVTLIDQNDQIPTFDIRSIVLSVVENESGNRVIAQIQAFDRDLTYPNNYVQYRLNVNLSDPGVIGVFFVASNGTISTNTTFDRESNVTLYQLFITAYDGAPAWNSQTNQPNTQDFQFEVQVIDVNDVPPGKYFSRINENRESIQIFI